MTQILDQASPVVPRRSERLSQPLERFSRRLFFTDISEATTFEESTACANYANWQLAMKSEMNSIEENKSWNLVKLLKNRRALQCRWVFQLKEISDLASRKYKVKFVATGFRQEYNVDFGEIFSLIVKMTTLQFSSESLR